MELSGSVFLIGKVLDICEDGLLRKILKLQKREVVILDRRGESENVGAEKAFSFPKRGGSDDLDLESAAVGPREGPAESGVLGRGSGGVGSLEVQHLRV